MRRLLTARMLTRAGFFLLLGLLLGSCNQTDHTAQIEAHTKMAGELQSNRLYKAAVEEYKKVLTFDDLDVKRRANICYLIGRISYEDLKDYETAAAYYLRAKEYDPEGSFMAEASRNLVASLEKLGNVVDAKRQLDAAANVGAGPASSDDVAIAKIDGQPVWLSQVNDAIAALDPQTQKTLVTADAKREFAHQFVGMELLRQAAIRENYLTDPEIIKAQEQMTRRLLINKYLVDNVMPKVAGDTLDVRNFYTANKDSMYGGAPYDSVKAKVFMDYQNRKAESAYTDYIEKLAKSQRVEFLDQNIR